MTMILLEEALTDIAISDLHDGYLVGGVVERGWSNRDADIVVNSAEITAVELPDYFDIIIQENQPTGPNISVSSLKKMNVFKLIFMKPKKTNDKTNEYYNIDDFKNFKGGSYFVEPKYDGIRTQLRKTGHLIRIITDEGHNIANKFPNIVEQARTIPYDSCILDCELVAYRGRARLTHTAVTAYIHSTTPPEDYHMRLKPFDIVYTDGEDLRKKQLADRKKALSRVKWMDNIHPVKYMLVKSDGLINAIEKMSTSEGAMIKDAESTYNTTGDGWWKWKRQLHIDAEVVDVHKKENGFVYTCKAGGVIIGDTYVTKVSARKGEIIEVSVDHVTKKKDGTWGWYAPKVIAVRPDKKSPDPLSVLNKLLELPSKNKKTSENIESIESQEAQDTKIEQAESSKTKTSTKTQERKPILQGKFVIQEHWWGKKHHFDLRFAKKDSAGKEIMIGWTLLCDSEAELFDKIYKHTKILALRKQYHDPKWLTFNADIKPGNPGNPTVNYIAHMKIRDKGTYKFYRRDHNFVEMELEGTKSNALKGIFYVRLVKLNNQTPAKNKNKDKNTETEDTDEKWLFWKAAQVTSKQSTISIPAHFRILESSQQEKDKNYIDIELNVISTNVTLNGSQYSIGDLEANSQRLNKEGGLIFAMGKHPSSNEEPDATDNVGIGMTTVENGIMKAKTRIYNTSTYPDMVSRIRHGLVRDISIEAFVKSFKRVCEDTKCWKRYIGTQIYRAVFVSAGADPLAKITRVLESLESNTNMETNTEGNLMEENIPETTNTDIKSEAIDTTETKEEKWGKTEQETTVNTEGAHNHASEDTDTGFKTNVLNTLSSIETAIAESRNQKEYTKSQIQNTLEYLKNNPGMADKNIKDVFYKCATRLNDKDNVKSAIIHLGENPGMVDDEMSSILKKLTGVSESEQVPDDKHAAESGGVPDKTKVTESEESGKVQITETGDGNEKTGKRIVESPASPSSPSSPPGSSTFTDEVRKHIR